MKYKMKIGFEWPPERISNKCQLESYVTRNVNEIRLH